MVPVRKPGRPLSTCPCPPGRPCACGGVRVAIPKKQKCACPTEDAEETPQLKEEPSPTETPTSPSRPSFRVGKPNGGSKSRSRKQSFDLANLERMDPRSVNVIPAPARNGITNGGIATGSPTLGNPHPELAEFGLGLGGLPTAAGATFASPQNAAGAPYASPQNPGFESPVPYNMGYEYALPNPLRLGMNMDGALYSGSNGTFTTTMPPPPPYVNGNHAPPPMTSPAQPMMQIPKANGTPPVAGSCCGSKAPKAEPVPQKPPVPQPTYAPTYIAQPQPQPQPPKVGSCCSGKAQNPSPVPNTPPGPPVFGEAYMPQFPFQTVFRYPGDYGSWQHPIDPIIWQQVASQTSIPLGTPMSPTTNNGDATEPGTSHQCSCGEGCQCVGCLAHPFNAQMFQYVNNAYSGSNGSSPTGADAGGGGMPRAVGAGQESPAEAPTPAASEGSPAREEQSLSTMDYFFVNLPISGLCGGDGESCPCGDSCDCPGCLVHNVPAHQV